jgi:hypothetical protein
MLPWMRKDSLLARCLRKDEVHICHSQPFVFFPPLARVLG